MMAAGVIKVPVFAAWVEKVRAVMEVILQIGGGPAGQPVKLSVSDAADSDIVIWTRPRVQQLFHGLKPVDALPLESRQSPRARQRAIGRVRLNLEKLHDRGVRTLLVSDADLFTPWREMVAKRAIYPAIGHRLSRVMAAFDGCVSRIVINLQAQDEFWRVRLAQAMAGGLALPAPAAIEEISRSQRGWRDVICDISCAAPQSEICVVPAESAALHPVPPLLQQAGITMNSPQDRYCEAISDGEEPDSEPTWDDDWQPFSTAQQARMLEAYGEDLFWLTSGAEGLATYIEEDKSAQDGKTRQRAAMRGPSDEQRQGNMDENR